MNLTTRYLGLKLRNPLVVSASPLSEDLDNLRRMEDAGASAIVLHSLFEEQFAVESHDLDRYLSHTAECHPEALSYFPEMTSYNLGPEGYFNHIRAARKAVNLPIIASLNGHSPGGWISFAKQMEEAGAHALELNIYYLPTNPALSGEEVERRYVDLVAAVKAEIRIPLAVKLGSFFSAPVHFLQRLERAGADGLVLFNRFYQPDFDIETLEVYPHLTLSSSQELLLRLHWIALLYGHVRASLAVTGGVHTHIDVLKAMMAGAQVVMMTSALMKHGIEHLSQVLSHLVEWMRDHEYDSIQQMQGSMSHRNVAEPGAFERANYLKVLRSYALRMTST